MKKSSIEFIVDNLLLPEYGENPEWVINIIQQAKEIHKKELESTYNHAMWALMDTGHGESFEEYYKNTYEKEN